MVPQGTRPAALALGRHDAPVGTGRVPPPALALGVVVPFLVPRPSGVRPRPRVGRTSVPIRPAIRLGRRATFPAEVAGHGVAPLGRRAPYEDVRRGPIAARTARPRPGVRPLAAVAVTTVMGLVLRAAFRVVQVARLATRPSVTPGRVPSGATTVDGPAIPAGGLALADVARAGPATAAGVDAMLHLDLVVFHLPSVLGG